MAIALTGSSLLLPGVAAAGDGRDTPRANPAHASIRAASPSDVVELTLQGSSSSANTPAFQPDVVGPWRLLTVGYSFACAVAGAGDVQCWGDGNRGQLGGGDWQDSAIPRRITGIGATSNDPVIEIEAGGWHACALRRSGAMLCWGAGSAGALGDASTSDRGKPEQPLTLNGFSPTTVKQMALGRDHTCAIDQAGAVWCWGYGNDGQLGQGERAGSTIPTRVASPWAPQKAVSISAGTRHTCVLDSSSRLWCWGEGSQGRLGRGSTTDALVPVNVSGTSLWSAVSNGGLHTCALNRAGRVFCWGEAFAAGVENVEDDPAVFGDTELYVPKPREVALPSGRWTSVSSGGMHTCATSATGTVACWGNNDDGQIGQGEATNFAGPDRVTLPKKAVTAESGLTTSCALIESGDIMCWGSNENGRAGSAGDSGPLPPTKLGSGSAWGSSRVNALATGLTHACLLTSAQAVMCWGDNGAGMLGNGTYGNSSTPTPIASVLPAGRSWTSVSSGSRHSCALDSTGAAWCWGWNGDGRLGTAQTDLETRPTPVRNEESGKFTSLVAGGKSTCGINTAGRLWCWGRNFEGQLGIGQTGSRSLPFPVSTSGVLRGSRITKVSVGSEHVCAVDSAGLASCWGAGGLGELGQGAFRGSNVPGSVKQGSIRFTTIEVGTDNTCAIARDRSVWCWGSGASGITRNRRASSVPVEVRMPSGFASAAQVDVTAERACAVSTVGKLACWGGRVGSPRLMDTGGKTIRTVSGGFAVTG